MMPGSGTRRNDGAGRTITVHLALVHQVSLRVPAYCDRTAAAGIATRIGCHSFRATGITEYLRNGGKLEIAQQMANHESSRTTGLYDRRQDQASLDEVERIVI